MIFFTIPWWLIFVVIVCACTIAYFVSSAFALIVATIIVLVIAAIIFLYCVDSDNVFIGVLSVIGMIFTYFCVVKGIAMEYEFNIILFGAFFSVFVFAIVYILIKIAKIGTSISNIFAILLLIGIFTYVPQNVTRIGHNIRNEEAKQEIVIIRTMETCMDSGMYEEIKSLKMVDQGNYLYPLKKGTKLWCDEIISEYYKKSVLDGEKRVIGYKVHTEDGKVGYVREEKVKLLDYATKYDLEYATEWDNLIEEDLYNGK